MAPVARADPGDPGPGAPRSVRSPRRSALPRRPSADRRARPAEGTEPGRGHAGRSERSDGGVPGRNTDFAPAAAGVHGAAAARLPQHATLLLEEAGAPPRTTQAGLGTRTEAREPGQDPGRQPRARAHPHPGLRLGRLSGALRKPRTRPRPPAGSRPRPRPRSQLQPGLRACACALARLLWPRPGGGARAGLEADLEAPLEAQLARQALRGQHGGARRAEPLRRREPFLLPARRRALGGDGRPGDGRARPGRGAERCVRRSLGPRADPRAPGRRGPFPEAALPGLRGLQDVDADAAEAGRQVQGGLS
ncbi:FAD-linked sulfhydryl oxidase ALR isoform X2 [Canis lupus dingo]|uniref:FAD-linked sulfhydryl oxidase ALR isoform X2 n=1 Tax=Canis lupus dingo TaxID=286419 RepID=UPI0020C1F372|nr:FAD-linked sulfhydryl oxidase ALR isoform X2 [Canis lupus dingo]